MDSKDNVTDSSRILQRVIDLLPTRIFWKDVNLVYLGCNETFAKDAGKNSPDELVGKTDYDMVWAEQADLYRADDKLVIDTGKEKLHYEEPQSTPAGETIWLRTSKFRLTDENGGIIGVLGMYDDITERKREETEAKNRKAELEKFNKIAIDRELKMVELKGQIKDLEARLKSCEGQ